MAALIKLRHMPVIQRCLWNHVNKVSRNISTSRTGKSSEAAVSGSLPEDKCETVPSNWVSYGFDYEDEKEDTNNHHASFFFSVTLCLVFGGFLWAYSPDVHMRDWAQREAFLELYRRERENEPLISPDYIPPEKMILPSEDELCDVEIII